MNWILAIFAFLKYGATSTKGMTTNQQISLFLTKLAEAEGTFF